MLVLHRFSTKSFNRPERFIDGVDFPGKIYPKQVNTTPRQLGSLIKNMKIDEKLIKTRLIDAMSNSAANAVGAGGLDAKNVPWLWRRLVVTPQIQLQMWGSYSLTISELTHDGGLFSLALVLESTKGMPNILADSDAGPRKKGDGTTLKIKAR